MATFELPRFRSLFWTGMFMGVLTVALLNSRFLWMDIRKIFHHSLDHVGQQDFSLYFHLYTSPLILVVGALLLHRGLRQRHLQLHRWMGRTYVVTILITSVATLHLSMNESEGPMIGVSFAVLSVLWFGTAAYAWLRAVQGRREEHSAWMVRNYALTLTNVTFRLDLHVLLLLGADVNTVYDTVRAIQPIPNLLVAEFLIRTDFFGSNSWHEWWHAIRRWGAHTVQAHDAPQISDSAPPPLRSTSAG